jgi:hypothetical protein
MAATGSSLRVRRGFKPSLAFWLNHGFVGRVERTPQSANSMDAHCCHTGIPVRRLLVLFAAIWPFVGAASAAAPAHTFAIRGDVKIGAFAVKANGTLAGAIDAFGQPTTLHRLYSGQACLASWRKHGLRIYFYNLGGEDACEPRYGRFARAIARGPHWQTTRRLKIGDSVRRLVRLYRTASFQRGERGFWPSGFWFVRRYSIYGEGSYYPGLLAETRAGTVVAFHVRYPAGGD